MRLFLINIPTCICFGIAGAMAWRGTEGWGWFLFIGLICMHTTDDVPSHD